MTPGSAPAEKGQIEGGDLEAVRRVIDSARRLMIFSGAGISAGCGVPTFRGAGGLWKRYRAQDLATPQAFQRDPRLVWEWYGWRRRLVAGCSPGMAHYAVARRALAGGLTVVTQNVDGLHDRSMRELGGGDEATLNLHGSLFQTRCTVCEAVEVDHSEIDARSASSLPRCGGCGGLLRPNVVWFGEALDRGLLDIAFARAAATDLCLVVGTSARVEPAASIPRVVRSAGGMVVEVNPEPTAITPLSDFVFRGSADIWLPRMLERPS